MSQKVSRNFRVYLDVLNLNDALASLLPGRTRSRAPGRALSLVGDVRCQGDVLNGSVADSTSSPLTIAVAALLVATAIAAPERAPKLVVLLMVDQIPRRLRRSLSAQWSQGLKRLVTDGAWFRQAAYPYANTVTCAGSRVGEHRVGSGHARSDSQLLVGSRRPARRSPARPILPSPISATGSPVKGGDSLASAAHDDARRRAARAAQSRRAMRSRSR